MPVFTYTATTHEGEIKSGSMIQDSKNQVVTLLQNQGLIVTSVEQAKIVSQKRAGFSLGGIKMADRVMMAKQLAVMIRAGIDMQEAISILQVQSPSKHVRRVLGDVLKSIEGGRTLSGSFEEHKKEFPDIMINMVRAGELGGNLEENLERLAIQLEKDFEVKKRIRDAMIYPSVIVSVAVVLLIVMSIFVLPKITMLFDSFSMELPMSTKIVIWFSKFMQKFGVFAVVGAILAVIGIIAASRTSKIKPLFHALYLRLPFISKMSTSLNLARFARTLGTLLKSGIPIVEALQITANTVDNVIYKKKVYLVAKEAQKGLAISAILRAHESGLASFPPIITRMAGVGEKTGKLEETLVYIAQFYEEEVSAYTKNLTTIVEPVFLILIALGIGGMVVSIILPVYQFTGQMGGG